MIHLVANPFARAGTRDELVRRVRPQIGEPACCVCPFPFEEHLVDHCGPSWEAGEHRLVVIGGDGTLNRVLNALGPSAPPIALIPGGTANDLAASIGVPGAPEEAARLAASGGVQGIDLLSVNGRLFATGGGIGLPARVARRANEWKRGRMGPHLARGLGRGVYAWAAMAELVRSHRPLRVEIETGGERRVEDVIALFVSNQAKLGGRYVVSPDASQRDGRFDVCSISFPRGAADSLGLLREAARGHLAALPFARSGQFSSLTIRTDGVVPFFGDGEILCASDTFHVRVLPSALRVLAPWPDEVLRVAA